MHQGPSEQRGVFVGPLYDLRVVDLTTSYAGPAATMYLADLGADVVKVERPGLGDEARAWGPPFIDGCSAWFASANRNKRSIVIDLKSTQGLAVLHTLIDGADVVIESLNPAKLARLGLDPASLRARVPRLIYCAMSGYGLDGPDRNLPGYDLAAQARSGLMSVTGARDGSPQRVSTALSDIVTGLCAALAICAAVTRQRRTGEGDLIDVSLLDSDLALMAPRLASFLAGEPEPAPSGGTDSVLAIYQTFDTADRPIAVAIGNDNTWRRFCAAAALPDVAADPALRDNAGRRAQRDRLTEIIGRRLVQRRAAEWLKVLAEAAVPSSLVQTLSEVVTDPHVEARGNIMPVPGHDGLYSVRSPFRLASIPEPLNERFPGAGAHTQHVLAEAGFSTNEIDKLVEAGAVQLARGGDALE
jgi:crotonobetainyl-CoA:carnitine CoA-transferase CaiB-like acyl-CoA transferase